MYYIKNPDDWPNAKALMKNWEWVSENGDWITIGTDSNATLGDVFPTGLWPMTIGGNEDTRKKHLLQFQKCNYGSPIIKKDGNEEFYLQTTTALGSGDSATKYGFVGPYEGHCEQGLESFATCWTQGGCHKTQSPLLNITGDTKPTKGRLFNISINRGWHNAMKIIETKVDKPVTGYSNVHHASYLKFKYSVTSPRDNPAGSGSNWMMANPIEATYTPDGIDGKGLTSLFIVPGHHNCSTITKHDSIFKFVRVSDFENSNIEPKTGRTNGNGNLSTLLAFIFTALFLFL